MWRDILIVLAFVLAALQYFRLTPKRISSYATTAKVEITKRTLYQKTGLFLVILSSLLVIYAIYVICYRFEELQLGSILAIFTSLIMLWIFTLINVWKVSVRVEKLLALIFLIVVFPLFITTIILLDMSIWQKFVYPIVGFFTGIVIRTLSDYLDKKFRRKGSSNK